MRWCSIGEFSSSVPSLRVLITLNSIYPTNIHLISISQSVRFAFIDHGKRIHSKNEGSEHRTWGGHSTFQLSRTIHPNWLEKTSANCEPHYFIFWEWILFELLPVCHCFPTGIVLSARIMQKRILSSYPTGESSRAFLSPVKPSNIVSTVNMKKEINLPEVVDKLRNTEYNPKVRFLVIALTA